MGLQDKITLATVNRAMDPYVAFSGEANLGADGLPMISGMIGSLPVRSWAETDNPGIQLITEQADLHQRPLTMHTDGYIMGWDTTDLLIEVYVQTGNRVGFDQITGADVKETLENIVYAPLNGVEQIDYRGGTRRALAENRIGEMNFLGQDGKTPAGTGNPPVVVKVGGQQHLVPMIIPLTDYQPAPDLRPGGADYTVAVDVSPTILPEPTAQVVLGAVENPIVFQSNRDGNNEIYLMDGDGSGSVNLTNNPADDFLPVWSPDGKKIIFTSNRDGNAEIYVMNADGSAQTNLTNNPSNDGDMNWSPDGTQIVFNSNRDGNAEIYVMNVDGSGLINLTNAPTSNDFFPQWSADGTQIGFTTNRDGNDELYLMNANGSNQTRLTINPGGDDAFPEWSLDGTKIIFVSGHGDGNYEIYLMNADGSGKIPLTDSPGARDDNMNARWSPDGTQILFWSSRDGNQELYVMNADGSHQTRLTDNPAGDSSPMLQP
jgi:TolB protein